MPAAVPVVLLTLGQTLVAPVARAWVPDLAAEGRLGLYTGALSSVSGLIVLLGSAGTGTLLDAGRLPSAVPWLVPAGVTAAAVLVLPRAGRRWRPARGCGYAWASRAVPRAPDGGASPLS